MDFSDRSCKNKRKTKRLQDKEKDVSQFAQYIITKQFQWLREWQK